MNSYLTELVSDIRNGTATYRPNEYFESRLTGTENKTGNVYLQFKML